MNKFFLLVALLAVSACNKAPTPERPAGFPPPVQGERVHCTYKYDSKYNVDFTSENKVVSHPNNFPNLTVYHITDLNGKHWSINEYEWADYTCNTFTQ